MHIVSVVITAVPQLSQGNVPHPKVLPQTLVITSNLLVFHWRWVSPIIESRYMYIQIKLMYTNTVKITHINIGWHIITIIPYRFVALYVISINSIVVPRLAIATSIDNILCFIWALDTSPMAFPLSWQRKLCCHHGWLAEPQGEGTLVATVPAHLPSLPYPSYTWQ